jgi:hypothetical protein
MSATELIEDIKSMRKVQRDYEHDEDPVLLLEVVSYVPKLLDLADLLVEMLQDEEVETENLETETIEDGQELMTSEMMILKGTQMIQEGLSIQKAETEIVFSCLVAGKVVMPNVKNDLSDLYAMYNASPNAVINAYLGNDL